MAFLHFYTCPNTVLAIFAIIHRDLPSCVIILRNTHEDIKCALTLKSLLQFRCVTRELAF